MMTEMEEIAIIEPDPDSEAVPRWKFAVTMGKVALFLMVWVLVTGIMIPRPDDKLDISVVIVQPNQTLVQRMKLPNDETMLPAGNSTAARLYNFPKNARNVSTEGLSVNWWDSGLNQTIPCTAAWSVFLEDESEDYDETYQLFEWTGNKTMVALGGKCEYSMSLVKATEDSPLLTHLWVVYGAFLLLQLYLLIAFEMTTCMYIAVLVATSGIAILAALGSQPIEQIFISWEVKQYKRGLIKM